MPCRGRIALVFQSPPEICPQISQRGDCADEEVWLVFFQAMVLYFLGFLADAAQFELVPRLLCPSAERPVTRNTTVAHFSQKLLHFCHHLSSAFCWVVPQPSSAEMSTLLRIYIPIRNEKKTGIREDANSNREYSANTFQEVFALLSVGHPRLASGSEAPFLNAVPPLGDGGSENGAVFGVGFARSWPSCWKLH